LAHPPDVLGGKTPNTGLPFLNKSGKHRGLRGDEADGADRVGFHGEKGLQETISANWWVEGNFIID
jgi:hypothetical protein